ncbi:MAG: 3-deoxy-D-manno-octulosonic acid transferase [Burkholderiaceae bacterium]
MGMTIRTSAETSVWEALSHLAYRLIVVMLLPVMLVRLWLKGGDYRRHLSERFLGRLPALSSSPVLWLHAVSVGETQAAYPLLRAWLRDTPEGQVLLTHTTPTGRATGARLFAQELNTRVFQTYLPYDQPWAVRAFLRQARPTLGLLMETELWPELLMQAEALGVPIVLLNGRLSARSARQMQRLSWLSKPALRRLALILVQADEHGARFQALSPQSTIRRTGNLKFDLARSADQIERGEAWRASLALQPARKHVVLLASSRDDEEAAFFSAWVANPPPSTLLVVVPRHPERFDRVVDLARACGLSVGRRSQNGSGLIDAIEVWVGDSLGEMQAYVAMSDLVVIGGSLLPLGGQNPIEACAQGRPVIFGPHMFNFPEVSRQMLGVEAAKQVEDAPAAIRVAHDWLSDEPERMRRGAAAMCYAEQHRGATKRSLAALRELGLL